MSIAGRETRNPSLGAMYMSDRLCAGAGTDEVLCQSSRSRYAGRAVMAWMISSLPLPNRRITSSSSRPAVSNPRRSCRGTVLIEITDIDRVLRGTYRIVAFYAVLERRVMHFHATYERRAARISSDRLT